MIQTVKHAKRVAFQGEPGAYANLAAREAIPHASAIPKPTFEDAIEAAKTGDTDLVIIPVENSLIGRIADIHHLLPDSGLHIVGEHFLPIRHQLLGLKDANLALAAGEAVGVPLPSGNVWRDRLVGALAHGEGEHDWAVMAKDQARASGLE